MRWVRRFLVVILFLGALAFVADRVWRGPDPQTILANLEVPPSPPLSPQEELATMRIAPGFRLELVASEPLVVDPVAMDWDEKGRLYVVEMRGFMRDLSGGGAERPVGRVVILEDIDGDGAMDERHVFRDGLVLPRAIAVLPEGILLGVPPDLLLCRDENSNLRCEDNELKSLGPYANDAGNVEHRENGLLPGIDGWIYNAKSSRRFRLREDVLEIEPTLFRGQWGLAQDDEGRLHYNHNSGFLYIDQFPGEFLLRQRATASQIRKAGINIDLAPDEKVWGIRVAPGLNRAYQPGTLRRNGRQNGPTGVSGLVIQRGDQYGNEYKGDAFVPESAGSVLSRFSIKHEEESVQATHHLYSDPDWTQREFIASTDERFRPVDAKVGPDGAVWMIDMYRGVIQHAQYVSDYLRDYIETNGLEAPGATGRIWRIVREDTPITYSPPLLDTVERLVAALDHPNGWVRDRAQRRLIFMAQPEAVTALLNLDAFTPIGRSHALWTLRGLGRLPLSTWLDATRDSDPSVRKVALRVGESLLPDHTTAYLERAVHLLSDPDFGVRIQAIHSLGQLRPELRPLEPLEVIAEQGSAVERQAVLSSLAGLESDALRNQVAKQSHASDEWIRSLTTAAFMFAQAHPDHAREITALLDLIQDHRENDLGLLLIEGLRDAQGLPGYERVVLGSPHSLFSSLETATHESAIRTIRRGFTWDGDPTPGGARALTQEESAHRALGQKLFKTTCATCHGTTGRGLEGLAPPLAGSPWVRDSDDWLVRIILQGLQGRILINEVEWNSSMPGHGHDPRFDDDAVAGLATHLRRSFGHADRPVAPETISRIRRESAGRSEAWTAKELLALPIEHRLDRYVGTYRIPVVGIEMVVRRDGSQLTIGRSQGGQAPLLEISEGLLTGEGMQLLFDSSVDGDPQSAEVTFGDQSITVSRVED
jgi:mono/diheme cytochrome c family protein